MYLINHNKKILAKYILELNFEQKKYKILLGRRLEAVTLIFTQYARHELNIH